ncbi:RNA polymerase sigma factor [Baekduia sp. Peel2402]|uniref:RNA polymerase sigma factor n=1 Tax=Baekduia sp. Peel2402 TaxID=3458296 RepID=UPI00403E4EB3
MEASALSHPVGLGRVSLAGPLLRLRTDDQLVALFRAGHDEAFGQIHDRYRARLFAYCRQMLGGSRGDAEDVLQDVFLRAYNSLRADRRDVALRAWLYRVAHNRCIDHLRRPTPAAEDIFDVNRGSGAEQPAEAAERREDLRRLIADVRALPEQQRSALLMREMEGLSYNDLAAALGVTVPAIKSLLVRARIGLVEAVEARDTACVEIRDDLDSAFGRGVRVSGRARKHLKECAGCRDYRVALRSVEKQLNGLAPSHGPLGLIAKLLGIGGAGSGGGAAVLGGGGAATTATVTTGTAATVGTSAVATKVVAVVAAAAVVGGGAATVQKVEHAVKQPAAHERVVAKPATASVSAVSSAVAEQAAKTAAVSGASSSAASGAAKKRSLSHTGGLRPASHRGSGATVTKLSTSATASAEAAPKVDETSGGVEAPADAATSTPVDPGGSGTATSGAAQGATSGAGSTATAGAGDAAAGSATTASGSDAGSAGTSGTSGTSGSTTSSSSSAGSTSGAVTSPSGTVSQGTTGPVAQGASATPTP